MTAPVSLITPDRAQRAAECAARLRGLADAFERGQISPDRVVVLVEGQGALQMHLGGAAPPPMHLIGLLFTAAGQVVKGAEKPPT